MFGNIFISSAIVLTLMFSASTMYQSYRQAQEAKQIQEQYEIIKDIKKLIAKQYNKNPEDITRDEIITLLPKNWSGVLRKDRKDIQDSSKIDLLDENANIVLEESEKIKLLALRTKLKNMKEIPSSTYTFKVGEEEKNLVDNSKAIDKQVQKAIAYAYIKLVLESGTKTDIEEKILNDFTPFNYMYDKTTDEKKELFKSLIKKRIASESTIEEKLLKEKNLF